MFVFSLSSTTDLTKQAPTAADFRVPTNLIEHNLIVARLVAGESLLSEAKVTIATRKTAFNKALRLNLPFGSYKIKCKKLFL